jgi:hypothetical protein
MQLNIYELDDTNANANTNDLFTSFENIPENSTQPKQITYEDILNKMNMCVLNGKLYLADNGSNYKKDIFTNNNQIQNQIQNQNIPQNSYIYNKYFKDNFKQPHVIRQPKTLQEYKLMLVQDLIQKQRIKQIKSKKISIPSTNINFSNQSRQANLNKLFNFSKS